ncbi:hypothetical protein [Methylobacterium sp. SyP6R]|uniref:hypothetical protein n=1 Tax=Methylobacterium sp. SyP6R TaxID=2718876 RepID=UPI001F23B647|nr:hypothetical protein [Methylobacterium sp. SyP6R]MCF4128797.1 hypothetical protein [Methylobacterium sp. SyP6R]
MTMALHGTIGAGLRTKTLPGGGARPMAASGAETRIADISRYRTIGSASALAAAVAASLVVTALLQLAL